ncbi:MAG: diadenylate cyclase [Firmicutes bacterium]|nr:diadenylate cyclase [Bacillota bacterium]
MRVTKTSYNELLALYNDFGKFMREKTHNVFPYRLIVLEYYTQENRSAHLSFFDSSKDGITKIILRNKKFKNLDNENIADFFELDKECVYIESDCDIDETTGITKSAFYVLLETVEPLNPILEAFVNQYNSKILERFNKRSQITATELLEAKEELFEECLNELVDFDLITILSGSQYEKRESFGSLIIVAKIECAEYKVKFIKPVEFSMVNLRLIRKILEMSDFRLSIIVHDDNIIGLGTADKLNKKVLFNGRNKWTLLMGGEEVLRFSRGEVFFDSGYDATGKLPKGILQKKYEKKFNDLVNILMRQKHGALLIITDEAQKEVRRLASLERGYEMEPVDLTENISLIKNIAQVDGAVFINRQLVCYGTGVILDGIAKRCGSNARGSRYNSSICYLDSKTTSMYVAVVFSEDETMDILYNEVEEIEQLSMLHPN